jgi:excisionase family DNA binding protein
LHRFVAIRSIQASESLPSLLLRSLMVVIVALNKDLIQVLFYKQLTEKSWQAYSSPMADIFELPEVPEYISTDQAAKILGISKQRVYQYIEEQRLPAFRAGNVILLQRGAVEQFKPHITGRPRKKEPHWRVYRGDSRVLGTDIQVQVRPDKQEVIIEKLKAIYKGQRHTFPGTIQRFVFKDNGPPATVSIWLVWKDTEMPEEATRERNLALFKSELADVLDWDTAQISTKEGIIYT